MQKMLCKANSCPLDAEFVTHWEEGRPKWGVCFYHRQADPENWSKTTNRILGCADMIRAARAIRNNHNPILAPVPGESVGDYLHRIESNINKMIVGEIEPADAAANFRKIIDLLSS